MYHQFLAKYLTFCCTLYKKAFHLDAYRPLFDGGGRVLWRGVLFHGWCCSRGCYDVTSCYRGSAVHNRKWHHNTPPPGNRMTDRHSGGSRIFLRGVRQLPKVLLFCNFLPKTAWKWKNLDPGGMHIPGAPLGSANETCVKTLGIYLAQSSLADGKNI